MQKEHSKSLTYYSLKATLNKNQQLCYKRRIDSIFDVIRSKSKVELIVATEPHLLLSGRLSQAGTGLHIQLLLPKWFNEMKLKTETESKCETFLLS